jgi:Ca2+-binding EF-hand superfamily protein
LKKDKFVEALNVVLLDSINSGVAQESAIQPVRNSSFTASSAPDGTDPATSSQTTTYSGESSSPKDNFFSWNTGAVKISEKTVTGFHVRQRFANVFKKLARVSEETPKHSSPTMFEYDSGNLVSLTELRFLVDALDGNKNGQVDYTLLMAALMPPDVYSEEARIREVFDLFDFQKTGKIGPEDVRLVLTRKTQDLKDLKHMVDFFDLDGDGVLDFNEFLAMVRGDGFGPASSTAPSSPTGETRSW